MANRIQGITIEIGGDTTKLSSSLRNVNRLLKLDPGNTDLTAMSTRFT